MLYVKGDNFAEYYKKRAARGSVSLRRAQMSAALGNESRPMLDTDGKVLVDKKGKPVYSEGKPPNITMQIWLGKQYLGQKENPRDAV